jgi:3-phosphoshikimate 1-carboxyvinyltransferase
MRLFSAIAATYGKKFTLTGTGSLLKRPVTMTTEPLIELGVTCTTHAGFPPIVVKGPVKGGKITIDGSISSQALTGLLMALPLCKEDSRIKVLNLKSKPYITMTLSLLQDFGISIESDKNYTDFFIKGSQRYKSRDYTIEGDWSGAAFLLTAGALSGKITVKNLQRGSVQGDKKIIDVLVSAGARINVKEDLVEVEKGSLGAFEFDATETPDLFPPLAALACYCKGVNRIFGIERLKYKESDRASVLISELTKIGARISVLENCMEIEGSSLRGGSIDSHNDHRIAMAGAVAALCSEEGVRIKNWQVVTKSYPDFFEDLLSIGGNIQ